MTGLKEMELINRALKMVKGNSSLILKPIGDIHLGASNCDYAYLVNLLKWVKKTKNCYVIGMGDYCDAIYGRDKRHDVEATDLRFNSPEKQANELYRLFKPIADENRLVGLLTGNHEDSVRKIAGIDITRVLCSRLGVPYLGMSAFVGLTFERNGKKVRQDRVLVYAHHGYFGGRDKGSKISNLMKISRAYEADIYLVGHCHDLYSSVEDKITSSNGKLTKHRVVYGLTGSLLKTVTEGGRSYGEDAGYYPMRTGTISIKINVDEQPLGLHVSE